MFSFRDQTFTDQNLRDKTDNNVQKRIIEPLLQYGANYFIRKFGRGIRNYYQTKKGDKILNKFQKAKLEHYEKLKKIEDLKINNDDGKNELRQQVLSKYNDQLLIFMNKTRDPELF
ncbi:unnamed protein product [Didymodactylos carnosus]|uniref:Uncharacterized protein n=1 Tax=Didymodactylos carnosus TaxID=1234261 RepID=A0A8S2RR83_9BILA|nr:unnamed protein product [Didymodactylos carnosus]CAF4177349.1 unnamed protein product [Didymodactylos carnosus]